MQLANSDAIIPPIEAMSGFLPYCKVDVLRADRIHSIISGNKVWKLHFNLQYAKDQGFRQIASFGGAFSNHLHALAYSCKVLGLQSIGFIRSHGLDMDNPTLQDLKRWGMHLHALSAKEYTWRQDADFLMQLTREFQDCFIIPEGGHNELGAAGVSYHLKDFIKGYDFICAAVGSGTTVSGICAAAEDRQFIVGIPVVNRREANQGLLSLDQVHSRLSMQWNYHWGGYARWQLPLAEFCNELYRKYGLPLEPIYTGKLFYAVKSLYQKDFFPPDSRILIIHSGGLQGARGLRKYRNLELDWMNEQFKTSQP